MTEQQPQPAPPTNSTEAQARLDTLGADVTWRDKFLRNDGPTVKEFHELTALISSGGDDVVTAAMSGKLPEIPSSEQRLMAGTAEIFRDLGIRDEVTSQFLRGQQVTAEEYQLVSNWKKEHMGDAAFIKLYLSGDVKAQQLMTIANSVLVNGVKSA